MGAALLLAAAGTFLAVAWDGLGLTARVAVVASITGAAILGGQRLRRALPAVGAVVFHLGALLLPVDALGLAYQLDASVAMRWAAVGLTASLALPALAVVGRSRVLALAGLAGLPVLATAAGIAGVVHPAVVVVAVASLAAAVEVAAPGRTGPARPHADRGRWRAGGALTSLRRFTAPGLAATAVLVPFVLSLVAWAAGSGTVLGSAASGWVASSWLVPALVGIAAVGVLGVTATRRQSHAIAGLALGSAVVSTLLTVLPPATPRAVLLLAPAAIWLLAEVAALAGRDHTLWTAPTRAIAAILEVLALVGVLGALVVLLVVVGWDGVTTDPALAAQSLTLAGAWVIAGVRRCLPGSSGTSGGGALLVAIGAVVVVQLAAASLQLGGSIELAGLLLVAGAVVSLGVLLGGESGLAAVTGPAARGAGPITAVVLLWLGAVVLADRAALAWLLVAVPVVIGSHLVAAVRDRVEGAGALVATTLVGSVSLLAWLAGTVDEAAGWHRGVAPLLAVLAMLALAAAVGRMEPAADSLRALAAVLGLVLLVPAWDLGGVASAGGRSGLFWAYGLRVIPAAVVPATVIGLWLLLDALRERRILIAALAAPVAVRALAAGLLAVDVSVEVTGALLLGVAIAAACAAAIGPRWLLAPMVTGGSFAGPVGWLLVATTPTVRASLVVAGGLAIVAVGVVRRRPVLGHLGGVVATVGIWWLLDIEQITALDLWLLPVALQLTVAGELARRRGTSSWVAFVPPLLLVAIPAIVERWTGGPGWHAVLAGGLGVAAIVAGGARRLGGPLIVGTLVTVAVVLVETFAVVAAVPTWVWLAVGGVLLLGAAALIERVGGSPVTAVRRAVDVVGERFD